MLRALVSDDQPTGQIGGTILVELPDFGQTLPVLVWGMLLSPEVRVVDFDDEMKKSEGASNESKASTPAQLDIKSALKLAVAQGVRIPRNGR